MSFFGGRKGNLRLLTIFAVVAVVVLAAVLIYATHYSNVAHVTVSGGQVHFIEGQGDGGWWFGPPTRNYSNGTHGFPISVTPGAEFSVVVLIITTDVTPHTIESITVDAPFAFAFANAALPVVVPPGNDNNLVLTLDAPQSSGTYAFSVTIQTQ